jgi:hypothetical protein
MQSKKRYDTSRIRSILVVDVSYIVYIFYAKWFTALHDNDNERSLL